VNKVRSLSLFIIALLSSAALAQADGGSFPPVDPHMVGDPTTIGIGGVPGCTEAIHDLYFVVGPDGNQYRTWHALWHPKGVNGVPTIAQIVRGKDDPECYFAHEHGDVPLAIAKPETGASLPPFGYAALRALGEVEEHAGFKIFTHLVGQRTGWHQPALGWQSREQSAIVPDWDVQVMVHQGTPSLKTEVNAPGSTRVTQRFHELFFWARDAAGRVTDVKVMGDTGRAIGSAGCGLLGGPAGLPIGRQIADGCDSSRHPTTYENWQFDVSVQGAWVGRQQVDVVNPMDFLVNFNAQQFDSASEVICGIEPNADGCDVKLPFGHPGTPALAFMGTQRNLYTPFGRWTNASGAEFICTDGFGTRVDEGRCRTGDPKALRQRVARIDFDGIGGGTLDRTGASSMFGLAFPNLTEDPARPRDCGQLECTWRMPQGAPLGN